MRISEPVIVTLPRYLGVPHGHPRGPRHGARRLNQSHILACRYRSPGIIAQARIADTSTAAGRPRGVPPGRHQRPAGGVAGSSGCAAGR